MAVYQLHCYISAKRNPDFDKYADMTREMMKDDSWLGYDLGCIASLMDAFFASRCSSVILLKDTLILKQSSVAGF